MVQVKIADLRPAFGVNWAELDQDRVELFRSRLDELPPVLVFDTPRGLFLVEGHHRLAAAQLSGRETIEAEIREGSYKDLLHYVTIADRERALAPRPDMLGERIPFMELLFRLLRHQLQPTETTLAESRAYAGHRPTVLPSDLLHSVTGPGNPVLVTDQRTLWMVRSDPRWLRELPFSEVSAYIEVKHGHRYGLFFEHSPMERLEWVPAHRFFLWSWGNAEAVLLVDRSFLAFSHRNTAAARAIRAQLKTRGVPHHEPVELPKDPQARNKGTAFAILERPHRGALSNEGSNGSEDEA